MRILLVTSRFPLPARRGNQVRTLQWADALSDHELTIACPRGQGHDAESFNIRSWDSGRIETGVSILVAAFSRQPLQEAMVGTPAARRVVRATLRDRPWDLVVIQMVRCGWVAELVRSERPGTPMLFDAIDSMGLHFARAARATRGPRRMVERLEAHRCRRRERQLADVARITTAVSDRDLVEIGVPVEHRAVVPVAAAAPKIPATDRSEALVVLTGNLGYRPTAVAAMWFATEVWPEVRRRVPEASWCVAGSRPPVRIRRLAARPGVRVEADPPELGTILSAARVAIAPMASGSGIPMKVIEAWAAGVPVVATPQAVEGLQDGSRATLSEATTADWIDAVSRLLSDPGEGARVAELGRAAWRAAYSPKQVRQAIRAAVTAAVGY